jgi:hypothetical protein
MKFLCVACDEKMTLERTLPPDNDAISAVFSCPSCGNSFAMHTNSMETQLVRSLDVQIGGSDSNRAPMQTVRQSLAGAKENGFAGADEDHSSDSGGKCPFTGSVTEAYAEQKADDAPVWTEGAEARMERVPSFIRSMVKKGIEDVAKQKGYTEITEDVMTAVRAEIGM